MQRDAGANRDHLFQRDPILPGFMAFKPGRKDRPVLLLRRDQNRSRGRRLRVERFLTQRPLGLAGQSRFDDEKKTVSIAVQPRAILEPSGIKEKKNISYIDKIKLINMEIIE